MHSLKPIDVLKMGLIEGDMAIVMDGVDHLARCVSTESFLLFLLLW
jgi:quercetin dioxygenase-like cupin family protein